MTAFWSPLSAVLVGSPPGYASAFLLKRALARGGPVEVVYAGDRMWPALRHGQTLRVAPTDASRLAAGDVVLAPSGGSPDLLRIAAVHPDGLELVGDADPGPSTRLGRAEILGRADLPVRRRPRVARAALRSFLDLREALLHGPDPTADVADTVRQKYERQAPFYRRGAADTIPAALLAELRRHVAPGGSVLVVGSGAGHECFALEAAGYRAKGIDFAPAMVALAREEASRRGTAVVFAQADLRLHEEPARSLGAVFFTYNVYSFLPGAECRIRLLERMKEWLLPGGVVLLSARLDRGLLERLMTGLQWCAGRSRDGGRRGGSHTRWIADNGSIHRSFVRILTKRQIAAEAKAAGWRAGEWEGGHVTLTRDAAP